MAMVDLKSKRIYVAGHKGMVGAAICRELRRIGAERLITASHAELNLIDQAAVNAFFDAEKPEVVVLAAAKVGGIEANRQAKGTFLYENILIAANVIEAARQSGCQRLLFLGSSCIYPRLAPQPMREDCLLTSALEQTNEGYALAKISGLKLCEYYRKQYGLCYHSAMPTNLYGTGDNYHLTHAHVLPTLIRKFDEAKERGDATVPLWGTGKPLREFLHVDDLASACRLLLELDNPPDLVNVGSGRELTIRELAEKVRDAVGCTAKPVFDPTMPDGTPRKLLDISLLKSLGWEPRISLEEGIARTVREYREEKAKGNLRMR